MQQVQPEQPSPTPWNLWLGALALFGCVLLGASRQWLAGRESTLKTSSLQDAP